MSVSLKQILDTGIQSLIDSSDSPRVDAEVLLCFVLKKPSVFLLSHPEYLIEAEHKAQFEALIAKRREGQPIAYLIGQREFWSLPLKVTPDTLIPRPETELLIERALYHLQSSKKDSVLDLGTGSGAIAIAISSERPNCQITAIDSSQAALKLATENACRLGCHNIQFFHSEWFNRLPHTTRFNLIVSNPPYLSESDPHLKQGDLRFEPLQALCSGASGLEDLEQIVLNAKHFLNPKGHLCLEHGFEQAHQVRALLKAHGYTAINSFADLQGHDRVTEACWLG